MLWSGSTEVPQKGRKRVALNPLSSFLRVAVFVITAAVLLVGPRAFGLDETVTYTMDYYTEDVGSSSTAFITIYPSGFENIYRASIAVNSHQFTSVTFQNNEVIATLDDGQFTRLHFPADFKEQIGPNIEANEVKAAAAPKVTVPNSTLGIATTSNGLFTVAVGFANTNSPIALVNNTTNKVQSLSFPGQAAEAVDIGDDGQTVVAAMGPLSPGPNAHSPVHDF